MKSKAKQLQDIIDIQCADGNWNYDSYMHGMANGLLMAQSIMDDKNPEFLDAPTEWLIDQPDLIPEKITEAA